MEPDHEIQRAIETRSVNDEPEEKSKTDIHPAVSSTISDRAEQTIRESGQDISSEYLDPAGKYYPFRILQPNEDVKRVIVEWFLDRDNLKRVAKKFEREVSPDPRSHLSQWFLISTTHMPGPGAMSQGMYPNDRNKIIIWIALGKLSPDNGLLHTMESGDDMSLNGHEKVNFSGKAGGLALLLVLNMKEL